MKRHAVVSAAVQRNPDALEGCLVALAQRRLRRLQQRRHRSILGQRGDQARYVDLALIHDAPLAAKAQAAAQLLEQRGMLGEEATAVVDPGAGIELDAAETRERGPLAGLWITPKQRQLLRAHASGIRQGARPSQPRLQKAKRP